MSSFVLKILACILMLVDHIGYAFFPEIDLLRVIGRLAFPIFVFQASIGFDKTKNKKKYILRMLIFGIISQIPFCIFNSLVQNNLVQILNIGATLTCGLLTLYCYDMLKNKYVKYTSIACIIVLSAIIPMDYGWYGVIMMLIFYIFKNDFLGTTAFFISLLSSYCFVRKSIFNLPSIFALIPIFLYNGKKGKDIKYAFYIFYPLHLFVLSILKNFFI